MQKPGIHTPNPRENYFAWRPERLNHFSVGVILQNESGEIAVSKLTSVGVKWEDEQGNLHSHEHPEQTVYFLPTSTHQPDSSLEQTLAKAGRKIGYEVIIKSYLGVIESEFPIPQRPELVVKNTLWMSATVEREISRNPEDRDALATVEWLSLADLKQIFATQARLGSDRDQRNVLELLET